jgi:hypothetical protein
MINDNSLIISNSMNAKEIFENSKIAFSLLIKIKIIVYV